MEPELHNSLTLTIASTRQKFPLTGCSSPETEITAKARARGAPVARKIKIEIPSTRPRSDLHTWYERVLDPSVALPKQTIELISPTKSYRLENAWPCGMGLGNLSQQDSSTVVTEYFEFVFERIEELLPVIVESPSFAVASSNTAKFGRNISITGPKRFVEGVFADLQQLAATKTGRLLFDFLDDAKHTVHIKRCGPLEDSAYPGGPPYDDLTNGEGKNVTVQTSGQRAALYESGENWDSPPTAIVLGHELIHAAHMVSGTMDGSDTVDGPKVPTYPGQSKMGYYRAREEHRTVGLSANKKLGFPDSDGDGEPFTENKLRRDMNEPMRTSYLDATHGGMW